MDRGIQTPGLLVIITAGLLAVAVGAVNAQDRPNIVLVFLDNFGWGEPGFNGGGIIRGAATPRLDTLASEGLRLTNFNVEVQCTPSRSAILTGRYGVQAIPVQVFFDKTGKEVFRHVGFFAEQEIEKQLLKMGAK